ncbi:MAG: hypothetical protein LBT59_27670 [Clostridiales bacterium]|jgi:multiple sugar transport system substrate-binding protein|nr:hypothetical protein [Clostridiales bacterium]
MFKKLVAAMLALLFLLASAGCMGSKVEPTTAPAEAATKAPEAPQAQTPESAAPEAAPEAAATPEAKLPDLDASTPITLHYATWDDYDMAELLASKFTEKYPNITVVVDRPGGTDTYMSALLTMASDGQLPDVYQFLELATPINNGWFYDFSEYWNNDPDTDLYLESLKESVSIDGLRAMRVVGEYLPEVAYLDRGVFNKLNVPMPDYNWTYDDMVQLVKDMTRPDQNIFGYNYMGGAGPVTFGPITQNDALSEFGWDGENYHLAGAWADSVNLMAQLQQNGNQALQGTDAWAAASGDANMWPGNSGLVAMQLDAWWTYNNIYTKSEAIEKGIDMVPYVIPRGNGTATNRKPAFLDYSGISSGTDFPREAYELLKWMSFSKEGWLVRIEGFKTLTDEAGNKIYDLPNCFPLINDESLWAEYRKLYPADEPAFDAFFELCREPVPLGSQGILGFAQWLGEVYQQGDFNGYTGVEAAVFAGALNANDATSELEEKGRQYYLDMLNVFYSVYGKP